MAPKPKPHDLLDPILIVPDVHAPYHDTRAWDLLMQVGRYLRPKYLVTIGDLADFYAVSSHSKDPARALKLDEEIAVVNTLLDDLDSLRAEKKVFIEGNHSDRLLRYLRDKAPELFKIISIPALFRLKERNWEHVAYKRHTKIGKLYLTHDIGSAGRNAIFRCLEAFEHSNVTGHTHRLAYVVEGNVAGERKVAAQFGWLGDINEIDYMSSAKARKDWALGFGIGYIHPKTGVAYLVPVPIVDYTCMVNGRLFTA